MAKEKGPTEKEEDVVVKMADVDAKFKVQLEEEARRIDFFKRRASDRAQLLKRRYKDEFLGPLWTDEVEERYQHYYQKRRERDGDEERKVPTRRFYLKYKVEKHLRRRAKWINTDTHRMVEAEQDAMLAEMIPEGTSLVICARLNFTTSRASRGGSRSTLATWRWQDSTTEWRFGARTLGPCCSTCARATQPRSAPRAARTSTWACRSCSSATAPTVTSSAGEI